jgi:DNA mismatch repair ATPase MutS
MEAEELSHPLLQSQNSISNPLQNFSKGEVLLITGSNMAGKTTFMRTVGINILFALCGGPILGKNFKLPSMKITCSLRNQDSLTEGISLFYAEAKRLGDIFKILKSNTQPILILLDEILKGTNTKERYLASEAILKNLQRKNTFTLCTTHDLELAKIPNLQLRHFTETISNNEMSFDFKIRDGVVSTTNALFILKREGVIV